MKIFFVNDKRGSNSSRIVNLFDIVYYDIFF